jgi:signal transduction histidine kinase/ligand-binding sensor domain-containing protein
VSTAVLGTVGVLCAVIDLCAVDPGRAPSQYIRDRWDGSNGFPGGPVYAISQAADGYLWIAADKGLVRFDGLNFRMYQPVEPAVGVDSVALQLMPGPDGALWARLRRATLVRYRKGAYERVADEGESSMLLTTAIAPAVDGAMLFADRRRGLLRTRGGHLETVVAASALPASYVISIAQTPNGDIWLGTRDSGVVRIRGDRIVDLTDGLPDRQVNCLLSDEGDRLWIGTDNGVVRWDGSRLTHADLPAELSRVRATAMVKDRDGNVWIGTSDGVLRLNSHGLSPLDRRVSSVTALFEDRDGDLWIGTARGIERWRDGAFTTYPEVRTVAAGNAGPILVDAADRVWFAPSTGGLYWVRDGRVQPVTVGGLSDDVIYSLEGKGTDLWIGRQRGGLTHLRYSGSEMTAETFTHANGLAQDHVSAVRRDPGGGIWAGTISGGVSLMKDGAFTNFTTTDGLASNTVAAVLSASDGTVWIATPNGVSVRSGANWLRYSTEDGLASNDVNALFEDSAHSIWVGTAAGLSVLHEKRIQPVRAPESLHEPVLGLAQDAAGWLWCTTADRVLRVDREGLLRGTLGENDVKEYGAADGLLGVEGVKRDRTLMEDAHGRIWVSTNGGLAMMDPARVAGRSAQVLVQIEGILADGRPVEGEGDVRVGSGKQRISIAFNGLSLATPERVKFRYRLDQFDRDWSAPATSRQAEYTNLSPGSYRFRVIASNGDGVWNTSEATRAFTVEPTLSQTPWFRLSVAALAATVVWGLSRIRVRQVARQMHLRFEERLAERTRIARELHDTLLQSFHGLLFRFQAANNMLPDRPAEAKQKFEDAIDHAARAITDGRDAVQNLRASSAETNDLQAAIGTLSEELAAADVSVPPTSRPLVNVAVEGPSRGLHPIVRDDIYRITGEALRNAFRHAQARHIEVEIRYDERELQVRVRDDGKGIDASVMDAQRPGHFGLPGMRERAELIGGRLSVWSQAGIGTEVDLTVPASAAYETSRARRRFWSFAGTRGGKT